LFQRPPNHPLHILPILILLHHPCTPVAAPDPEAPAPGPELAPTQIPYCWCVGAAPGTKKPPWGTAAGAIMGASTFSGAADMGAPEGLNTST